MKKLFFGLACVIGLMFFASCTQEVIDDIMAQKPTVEFVSGEGLFSGNTGVYVGTELNFKVRVEPNSGSLAELTHFDFSIADLAGNVVFNENPAIEKPAEENFFEFSFTPEYASTYAVTASISDKAGKANVATVVIDYVEPISEGIGTYSGTITLSGHITSNEIAGHETYDMDMDPEELATTITMGTVGEEGRVRATFDIDGTPVSLYGTMGEDGVTITFDQFHFNKTISLFVNVTLDLAMDLVGTLGENDVLTLTGTAVGSGKTQVLIAFLEVNFDGTIEGSLEKVAE